MARGTHWVDGPGQIVIAWSFRSRTSGSSVDAVHHRGQVSGTHGDHVFDKSVNASPVRGVEVAQLVDVIILLGSLHETLLHLALGVAEVRFDAINSVA